MRETFIEKKFLENIGQQNFPQNIHVQFVMKDFKRKGSNQAFQ